MVDEKHHNIAEDLRPLAIPIEELQPDPINARTGHDLDRIASSLEIYGQRKPIVVNRAQQNKVEAGNGTLAAARKLGWTHIAAVFVEDDPATAAGYGIADNRTAELSDWDAAVLDEIAPSLGDDIFTGFETGELEELLQDYRKGQHQETANDARPEVDRRAELQQKWGTELGQLWQIGEHRLLCGDATEPADTQRLQDIHLAIMVTDPPYGVEYDPTWREEAIGHVKRDGKVANDHRYDWTPAYQQFPGDIVYLWHAVLFASQVRTGLEAAGFEIHNHIIWAKTRFPISRAHYHWKHETCWYATRRGRPDLWQGAPDQSTIWTIELDEAADGGHGTQKPLEAMARAIRNHAGDIYEPFAGSGTTLVASENLGRRCRAAEIDPQYVAVILERMATAFPGIEIRLLEDELT